MTVQSTQANSYIESSVNCMQMVKKGTQAAYACASKEGETQKKVYAFMRTGIGIAAISSYPGAALFAAAAGASAPSIVKRIAGGTESMITGLWNSMSFDSRIAASVAGVSLTVLGAQYLPMGVILYVPGAILSAKLGAELALNNTKKEEVAAAVRQVSAE